MRDVNVMDLLKNNEHAAFLSDIHVREKTSSKSDKINLDFQRANF